MAMVTNYEGLSHGVYILMVAIFKPIKPANLRVGRIRLELLNGLRKVGRGMVKDYKKTVAKWKGEKPTFKFKISLKSGGPRVTVEAGGSEFGQQKWKWVSEGTDVRFATMTPDFSPKTMPGVIGSSAGSGGLLFVNTSRPKPGIEAREFNKQIQEKWTPEFFAIMNDAMARGAKLSGHSLS